MKRPRRLGQRSKAEARRAHDASRAAAQRWRRWYGLAVWKRIRDQQLAEEPYCARHLKRGVVVLATVVNHVGGHGGDWDRFIGGPFESCCKPCHDRDVQREEKAAARAAREGR